MRRAEQDQVLEDLARRAGLNAPDRRRIAAQAFAQVDDAVGAERGDRLAGLRVDLLQVVVHAKMSRRSLPSLLSQ